MKVSELLQQDQQLDEISLKQVKHAAAAGVLGAALAASPVKSTAASKPPTHAAQHQPSISAKVKKTIETLSKEHHADPEFIEGVVKLAMKYARPNFPTANDILAIIGVESHFKPNAESNLKKNKAVGLMQVRPGDWGKTPEELKDPETAIKTGADILHRYYRHLGGDKEAAVQAYNVGMHDFKNGKEAPGYLSKYKEHLASLNL